MVSVYYQQDHLFRIIRMIHEYEGGIDKSIPMITDWHYETCRVMTNGDRKGWIFLSNIQTNNGLFFLLTTYYHILYWKNMKKPSDLTVDSKEGVSNATGELGCAFSEINKAVHLIIEGQSDFQQIPIEL